MTHWNFTLSPKYEGTRTCAYIVFLKHMTKNKTKVCSICSFDGSGSKFKTCNNEIPMGHGQPKTLRCNGSWTETISPKAEIQIVIDTIPETVENMILDNVDAVNASIKSGIITRNLKGCLNDGYNRRCQYFDICYNGDAKG